jgi:hypothetical protein
MLRLWEESVLGILIGNVSPLLQEHTPSQSDYKYFLAYCEKRFKEGERIDSVKEFLSI